MKTRPYFVSDAIFALMLGIVIYVILAGVCIILSLMLHMPITPESFLPFYPNTYPVAFGSFLLCFLLAGIIVWMQKTE